MNKTLKKFITVVSVILVIAIIVTTVVIVSSSGAVESKNPTRPEIPTIGTSFVDLDSDEYTEIASNDNVTFKFNYNTTDIQIINNKTGHIWCSEWSGEDGAYSRGEVFKLEYSDSSGALLEKESRLDSIEDGKFVISEVENGVKIQYGVGDVGAVINFPMALSPERYEAYYAAFAGDPYYAGRLEEYYERVDYTDADYIKGVDPDSLEMNKKQYSKALDGPWYYITNSLKADQIIELNSLFEIVGYDEAAYKEDNKGVTVPELSPVEFNISIIYTLGENGLSVTIPEKEIYYNKDYPLESVIVLPNLMDFDNKTNGYFLLPDGSGSIMNFNNNKESLRDKSVYVQMYGVDNSRVVDEKTAYYNDAIMPVFGAYIEGKNKKDKDDGLFGIITAGETFAGIEAHNYDAEASKNNNLSLEFRVNERVKMDAFTASGDTDSDSKYCKYQFQRYLGDIKFDLNVLSGNDATYSGMAKFYSDYLFGDEATTGAKDYYSTVEMVGVINATEKFLGIEYNTKVTLTNYDDVLKIASELKQNGFNNMNVKLTGWCNGGYEHGMIDKIKLISDMGDKEGLTNLYNNLGKQGIGLYPDVDFQNVYYSEEKPSSKYIAQSLNGNNSVISTFSPVDFIPTVKLSKFALNKDGFTANFNGFMADYKQYGINNISFRSIGKEITSNFKEDETYMERQDTLAQLVGLVSSVDKDYSIMGNGGQAAYLKYLDVINEMPIESSHFDKCDYSVPFTAMVLSGHVDYTYKPINLSNNNRKDLLQLIESGAGANYLITKNKYENIANSSYDGFYSTVYGEIKDDIIESYSYVEEALQGVYGLEITNHERVADEVYKTTYSNGTEIYVNYSNKEYKGDNITVAAEDYLKVKGAAE